MEVVRIPLVDASRAGGRPIDHAAVALLKNSLTVLGQLNPILVTRGERSNGLRLVEHFTIVAGKHRAEAARELGWTEIEAVILDADVRRAELIELDENLARNELGDAQRAKAHARREELMVEMGLAAAPGRGGDRTNEQNVRSYSAGAATALGVHEKTVRLDLSRGKKIDAEVLDAVAGTSLDKGVVLDELAATPQPEQRAKLAEITARRQEAERVRREADAATRSVDRNITRTKSDDFAAWLWGLMDPAELPAVIDFLEGHKTKLTIAALRREAA